MTDRSDRPMSSDEMLNEARRDIQRREPTEPVQDDRIPDSESPRRVRSPEPRRATRAGKRPAPPEKRSAPPIDPRAQRRAVIVAAVGVALVIAGFVAAIVFASAGV